ncbi:hypothetical protein Tco_0392810 [Tanacetum coccineum]
MQPPAHTPSTKAPPYSISSDQGTETGVLANDSTDIFFKRNNERKLIDLTSELYLSIHREDRNPSRANIKQALGRIHIKMENGDTSIPAESDSQPTMPMLNYKDNTIRHQDQLIIRRHEVQFNHALFNPLSNEIVSDVNVLGPGVLDIVAAESNSTVVVTIHGNLIEGKTVVYQM